MARDERLQPVQQTTALQTIAPGRRITEQQVEQLQAGSGTLTTTSDVAVVGSSGTEEMITVIAQYPDGYPSVVSVETRKSDRVSLGLKSD